MFKQPHPESSMTKKSFSLAVLSIIFVCLSMVTYNASSELYALTSLNDMLEKIAHSGIDMCNHTHEYICSNFPSSSQSDYKRNEEQLLKKLDTEGWQGGHALLELEKRTRIHCKAETISSDEPGTVQKQEDWYIVSEIVNDLGGWPLVQNASRVNWNSSIFNWIDTICELRKIGIPPVLLKLSVIPNPAKEKCDEEETDDDKKCPLLKLDIISNNYYKRDEIIKNRMVHLVRMFQLFQPQNIVLDEPKVREAYNRVVEFAEKLNKFTEALPKDSPSYIYTIKEITKETVPIDWLKLLNGLSGQPTNVIDNEEVRVAFPKAHKLKKFIQFITDTPEEVVANYIIWTVVYESLPYLPTNVREEMEIETAADFCLTEVEKRFELSPVGFLLDEEYFPPEFRKNINKFISKLKDGAIAFMKRRTLIRNVTETEMIINETQKLRVQIARPEEYYNITELDARLMNPYYYGVDDPRHYYREESRRFLTDILLLNRINDFVMFDKVVQQKPAAFDLEYIKNYSITYLRERNIIFVPRVVFQRLYSQHLAEYVNWARLGTTLLSYFFKKFEEHREYRRENNYTEIMEKLLIECYNSYLLTAAEPMKNKYKNTEESLGKHSARQVLAGEAALWLYKTTNLNQNYDVSTRKYLKANYTPDDVFWTLMASTFCFRSDSYDDTSGTEMVFNILFENTFFKEEFMNNCSSGSKIHRFDTRIKIYDAKKEAILKS